MGCDAQNNESISGARRTMRAYYASLLVMALNDAHPDDVDAVVAEWLTQRVTRGPQSDVLGTLWQDAVWWAETAPRAEIQAYIKEGLRTLGSVAIGPTMRKQVFARLWSGFSDADKAAFIERVGRGA